MLSRLLITGGITGDVPLCIISEIADAHGINYNFEEFNNKKYVKSIIETINNEDNVSHVKFPITNLNDWECLARFINKSTSWPQNTLLKGVPPPVTGPISDKPTWASIEESMVLFASFL